MTRTTPLANASSTLIETYQESTDAHPTSTVPCEICVFEDYVDSAPEVPAGYVDVAELGALWEHDESRRAAMGEARQWVANTFHGEDGDTVRTMRLCKGWSQTRLAEAIGTSQPHIVRIERGTENLVLKTCRKLCRALEIDMNALDAALRRQEAIAQGKT